MIQQVLESRMGRGVVTHQPLPDGNRLESCLIARSLRLGNALAIAVPERQCRPDDDAETVKTLLALVGGTNLEIGILTADLSLKRGLTAFEAGKRLLHLRMAHEVERIQRGFIPLMLFVHFRRRHLHPDTRQIPEQLQQCGLLRKRLALKLPQGVKAFVPPPARRRQISRRDLARLQQLLRVRQCPSNPFIRAVGLENRHALPQGGDADDRLAHVHRHVALGGTDRLRIGSRVAFRGLRLAARHT